MLEPPVSPATGKVLANYLLDVPEVPGAAVDGGAEIGGQRLPWHGQPPQRVGEVIQRVAPRLAHILACDYAERVLYLLPMKDGRALSAIQVKRAWIEAAASDRGLDSAAAALTAVRDEVLNHDYDMDYDAWAARCAIDAVIAAVARDPRAAPEAARLASQAANVNMLGVKAEDDETCWQMHHLLGCLGIEAPSQIAPRDGDAAREAEAADELRRFGAKVTTDGTGSVVLVQLTGYHVQESRLLQYLPHLKSLALSGSHVLDSHLQYIKRLNALEFLAVGEVSDAALVWLWRLVHLRSLVLWGTRTTDAGLAHVQWLPDLTSLDISSTRVTDLGVALLKRLGKLEELNLSSTGITDKAIEHLAALPALTSLDVHETRVTPAGVKSLSQRFPDGIVVADDGTWSHGERITM